MSKITGEHLKRAACVYVRQSSVEQLHNNTESRRRQYALAEKARGLGFSDVMVIDEDLGRSGSGIARPGFERLLALICEGRIGAVFAIEASRLARNGRDWHTLIELCGLVNAILMDEDGDYDPRHPNDRLLLGMKGTMSELELSLLRQRALEAIRSKAARGELYSIVAVGYVRNSSGRLEKDADRRVREALELVFRKFEELRSARQVLLWLREHGVELPAVMYGAEGRRVLWAPPSYSRVHRVLHNPVYAGAYVFGRSSIETRVEDGRKRLHKARVAHPHWRVCKPNHHEGYIDWETYLRNQRRLAENANMRGEAVRGSVRRGEALLVGLLRCGHCGRKLAVAYTGEAGLYPRYYCRGAELERMNRCISFAGWRVERAVTEELLKVVTPLGVEAALQAIDACDSEGDDACRQIETALEQARYEARLAQRQYEACDPDNRLVAAELERRWNDRLVSIARLQEDLTIARQSAAPRLSDTDRAGLRALGEDLPRAWHDPSATAETRKRILRAAVKEIVVRVEDEKIQLLLHWQGGDHTVLAALKNKAGEHRWKTEVDTEQLIAALARQMADFSLASLLNRIGVRSAKGLTWNEARLRSFRSDRSIPVYREGERAERGELTLDEAARELGISKMTMLRLIERRVVAAQQVCPQAPWVIRREEIRRPEVQQALRPRALAPQSVDPDQSALKLQ
jgi:DNA invertase Pin-like site-specific DNA recombinase